MAVYKTVYEEIAEKARDKTALRIVLCDIMQMGEHQCDGCPVTELCGYGHNGWKEFFEMSPDVFYQEGIYKKWKEKREA